MKLSNLSQNRDNNFNLIRIIAALGVLVTHCFALSVGTEKAEPLRDGIGMTLGSISVDVFFITSGFLVTSSLLNRRNAVEFTIARILRIFPALLVMLILTVFVLGTCFTTLPIRSYLSDHTTHVYLAKCSTLIFGVAYDLPGVFENNPYKGAVNGSLWSMRWELRMYALLAVLWLVLGIARSARLRVFKFCIVLCAVLSGIYVIVDHFSATGEIQFLHLSFMFFSGAAFYVLKEYISLSRPVFWILCIALICSMENKAIFFIVYTCSITYLLLFVAYVPSGFIRQYNLLGDYSYGIYIYAFPIQQTIAALIPGISVLEMFLISTPVTVLSGAISWHALEKRVLRLKNFFTVQTGRLVFWQNQ